MERLFIYFRRFGTFGHELSISLRKIQQFYAHLDEGYMVIETRIKVLNVMVWCVGINIGDSFGIDLSSVCDFDIISLKSVDFSNL